MKMTAVESTSLISKSNFNVTDKDNLSLLVGGYARLIIKVAAYDIPDDIVQLLMQHWQNIEVMYEWKSNKESQYINISGDQNQNLALAGTKRMTCKGMCYYWLQDGITFNNSQHHYEYKIKFLCNYIKPKTPPKKVHSAVCRWYPNKRFACCSDRPSPKRGPHICLGIGILREDRYFSGYQCCEYDKGYYVRHKLYQISSHSIMDNEQDECIEQGKDMPLSGDFIFRDKDVVEFVVNSKSKTMALRLYSYYSLGNNPGYNVYREWEYNDFEFDQDKKYDICVRLSEMDQSITVQNYSFTHLS